MSTIVKSELYYGAYRSVHPESKLQLVQGELVGGDADATAGSVHLKSNLQLVQEFLAPFATIPLDDRASEVYGRLRTSWLSKARSPTRRLAHRCD